MDGQSELPIAVGILARKKIRHPDLAIISGSGQGWLSGLLADTKTVPYAEIPFLPRSHVKGHDNLLVFGSLGRLKILLFSGRFHLYEGFSAEEVTRPVRIASEMGTRRIIIMNASGGINARFQPGDLMAIKDHLNLTGTNPLVRYTGKGERFVSMDDAYSREMIGEFKESCRQEGVRMHEGIYAAMLGPNYETPAEIRMLRKLGADAVGMSTVPEVLMARRSGMDVLGISIITNIAGKRGRPPSHDEVLASAARAAGRTEKVLRRYLGRLSEKTDASPRPV